MTNTKTQQTIDYLQDLFNKARDNIDHSKNGKGTPLHKLETDFMYALRDIKSGAPFVRSEKIQEANTIIETLQSRA